MPDLPAETCGGRLDPAAGPAGADEAAATGTG